MTLWRSSCCPAGLIIAKIPLYKQKKGQINAREERLWCDVDGVSCDEMVVVIQRFCKEPTKVVYIMQFVRSFQMDYNKSTQSSFACCRLLIHERPYLRSGNYPGLSQFASIRFQPHSVKWALHVALFFYVNLKLPKWLYMKESISRIRVWWSPSSMRMQIVQHGA